MELLPISAIVVTRGDEDLTPTLKSLSVFDETYVWDNSDPDGLGDFAVYGRYAAIDFCRNDLIFVQDDDVVLPRSSLEAIVAAYEPGEITANMPVRFRHDFYVDHCLVGFGAIFDRGLPMKAFQRFDEGGALRDRGAFYRACDVVFTALTPYALVDVPYEDREFASAPNRMWKQPGHVGERQKMLDLVRQVRDA